MRMAHQDILCVYHKNCIDGTASASIILHKYPQARTFPLSHSSEKEELNSVVQEVGTDTTVFLVDCAIGVEAFLKTGAPVVVIDHHIGVRDELEKLKEDYPNLTYHFNNERSGTSLCFQVLFPEEDIPYVVLLIEDSDLWTGKYGIDTRYANNFLSLYRNDPTRMLACIVESADSLIEKGMSISHYIDKEVEGFVDVQSNTLMVNQYDIPAFNITTHQSYAGNLLSVREASVVALYTIKGDRVTISFRSQEGQSPTSLEVAQLLGGGGHVHSSGASMPYEAFKKALIVRDEHREK